VYFSFTGTASWGTDYLSITAPRTIPVGATFIDVTLTPVDDAVVETDETAIMTLKANAAYTIGTPSGATITITSNE
jgi:hypothetical protein